MAVYDEHGNWVNTAFPKPEGKKKKGGNSPRKAGDRVERKIADTLGEKRNVGSGAFKQTNKNLTGDIDVRDNEGRDYVKMEVKMTGQLNTKGEKVYSLQEKVLKQFVAEAHAAKELAALAVHYKNGDTFVVMPLSDWQRMLEDAKLGRTAQQ
jgi:hypothetical protein